MCKILKNTQINNLDKLPTSEKLLSALGYSRVNQEIIIIKKGIVVSDSHLVKLAANRQAIYLKSITIKFG